MSDHSTQHSECRKSVTRYSPLTFLEMHRICSPSIFTASCDAVNMLGEHIHCTWALILLQWLNQFKCASELNLLTYFHNTSRCMTVIRLSDRISVQCDHSPSRSNPTNNDVCLTRVWQYVYLIVTLDLCVAFDVSDRSSCELLSANLGFAVSPYE